jgi:hypothetical protein
MRKTAVALGTSLFVLVVTALPALADSSLPKPHVGGVSGAGGTAFTGSNLSPIMVAFVFLAIVGVSVLALQRRRSVTS